jgi:hypothetical protein
MTSCLLPEGLSNSLGQAHSRLGQWEESQWGRLHRTIPGA